MKTFNVTLTESEVDTILAAMSEYILHDDPEIDPEDLIGGTPVVERVQAIEDKLIEAKPDCDD